MELSYELMCSFKLEFIVKFLFHYCYVLNGFLENFGVHLFSSFTITMNFPYQLITDTCELVLKD